MCGTCQSHAVVPVYAQAEAELAGKLGHLLTDPLHPSYLSIWD